MISSGVERKGVLQVRARTGKVARERYRVAGLGLGLWIAAAVAALLGELDAARPDHGHAVSWLMAAALLGLASVRVLEGDIARSGETAGGEPPVVAPWERARAAGFHGRASSRRLAGRGLIALGALAVLVSTVLLIVHGAAERATSIWVVGLAWIFVGSVFLGGWGRRASRRWSKAMAIEVVLLAVVVGLAVGLRLPDLAAVPPNVHGDEAAIGLGARQIFDGELPAVFATGWSYVPALSFAISAITMRVFGDDLFGLRMASAIEGILTIVLLYLLTRRLWGVRPALVASVLLTIAAWHIHFSRTGFHYMQAPLAVLLALYFLVRGVQDRRLADWVACGFALGLSVEVYYAARLAPVLVLVYLGYRTTMEGPSFLRAHAPGLLALAFGTMVFLAPMAVVYARSPEAFAAHTASVSLADPSAMQHELDAYHVSTVLQVLAIQVQRTLEAFHILGETSLQYGHPAPLFDVWTGALVAMSALAIFFRPGSARGILLAAWVWLTLLLGSVLTLDPLFSPHVLVAVPALMLGSALMVEQAWCGATRLGGRVGTYVFGVVGLIVLGLALHANLDDYFGVQVVQRQPATRFTLLSEYAAGLQNQYRLYVIGRSDWTLKYDTPRFLVPGPDAVDVRDAPLSLPLDQIPQDKGAAFLVENAADDYAQRMAAIESAYPGGQQQVIDERPGKHVLTGYLVEHAELAEAQSERGR
jgi:4-amino-4-deoxy-L-arabinose transferase-like glycosyltransferase